MLKTVFTRIALKTRSRWSATIHKPQPAFSIACAFKREPISFHIQRLTPAHNGALGMEAQPQCKGRPAATGRVLMRLVIAWVRGHDPLPLLTNIYRKLTHHTQRLLGRRSSTHRQNRETG